MLEQALNTTASTQKPDAAYKSWQSSVSRAVMRHDPDARTAAPIPTFGKMVHETALAAQKAQAYAPGDTASGPVSKPDIAYAELAESGEYTFGDVLDIINPLQHIPVLNVVYRKLTGDTIKPMSNIIGGAIFGGPVGAVASAVNVAVKSTTGKDIAENAFAMAGFDITSKSAPKPVITYDRTAQAAPAQENNLAQTNIIKLASANDAYLAADGRRNFASRHTTEIWNA